MQGLKPILVLCGTRPEAIKLAPVVQTLRQSGSRVDLVMSGQHPDLARTMLEEVGLVPDVDLGIYQAGGRPDMLLSRMLPAIGALLQERQPAMVVVQGDTLTAFAGAASAAYAQIPVAHIEAGLRTGNNSEPHPEEMHRTMISRVADLHFAPTEHAAETLRKEGVNPATVHVTGNTGIDALIGLVRKLDVDPVIGRRLQETYPFVQSANAPLIVATIHRRENIGQRLQSIAAALARLVGFFEAEIVLPLHPNPVVRAQLMVHLRGLKGCHLIEPVDHMTMVWLLRHARLLLTDSGGLQEEAPTLGLRTLVLRKATERPEGVAAGVSSLVSLSAGEIVAATQRALKEPRPRPCHPFGDGKAAGRIADVINTYIDAPARTFA